MEKSTPINWTPPFFVNFVFRKKLKSLSKLLMGSLEDLEACFSGNTIFDL
jgi:hypothetical protein